MFSPEYIFKHASNQAEKCCYLKTQPCPYCFMRIGWNLTQWFYLLYLLHITSSSEGLVAFIKWKKFTSCKPAYQGYWTIQSLLFFLCTICAGSSLSWIHWNVCCTDDFAHCYFVHNRKPFQFEVKNQSTLTFLQLTVWNSAITFNL